MSKSRLYLFGLGTLGFRNYAACIYIHLQNDNNASSIVCGYRGMVAAPRWKSGEFLRRKVKVTMLKDREKGTLGGSALR